MPKKGGPGSRKSIRVEEKAALEAEQAAAVVDSAAGTGEGAGGFRRLGSIVLPSSCLLYTSPSPRDGLLSRMPSSA